MFQFNQLQPLIKLQRQMQKPAHTTARVGVGPGEVYDGEQGLGRSHQAQDNLRGLHPRVRRRSRLRQGIQGLLSRHSSSITRRVVPQEAQDVRIIFRK